MSIRLDCRRLSSLALSLRHSIDTWHSRSRGALSVIIPSWSHINVIIVVPPVNINHVFDIKSNRNGCSKFTTYPPTLSTHSFSNTVACLCWLSDKNLKFQPKRIWITVRIIIKHRFGMSIFQLKCIDANTDKEFEPPKHRPKCTPKKDPTKLVGYVFQLWQLHRFQVEYLTEK